MSTQKRTKINKLLSTIPPGVVILISWLQEQGYSRDLINRYKRSGWFRSIGNGALVRSDDEVDIYGALFALQQQGNRQIHIGGRSALSLLGQSQYIEMNPQYLVLFGSKKYLPCWFKKYEWGIKTNYHFTTFLSPNLGITSISHKGFSVHISNGIRGLMECLFLAPDHQEISECYEIMENLNNVRPEKVQELLQNCSSIKVKRLFLSLAENIGHEWFHYIDTSKIDLGKGKRSFVKGGIFDKKYLITVPQEWLRSHG